MEVCGRQKGIYRQQQNVPYCRKGKQKIHKCKKTETGEKEVYLEKREERPYPGDDCQRGEEEKTSSKILRIRPAILVRKYEDCDGNAGRPGEGKEERNLLYLCHGIKRGKS